MKKIVAAIGALLFVGGVKAQTEPKVKKPTTPQVKNNVVVTPSTSNLKLTQKAVKTTATPNLKSVKDATIKKSTIKAADNANKNIKMVKAAPTIKK